MMKFPLKAAMLLIALVGLAMVVSACGDDDDDDGGGDSGSPSAATTPSGPSGPPIKVGFICSCSGAQAASLAGQDTSAQVWADSVNDAGGLNGSRVDLVIKDDGGEPARALQAVQDLVESEQVIALINYSLADAAFADYVTQRGVPVVGGVSPEAPYLTNPNFYPSGSQLLAQTAGTLELAAEAGKQKIGVMYCAESPICAQLEPLIQGLGQIFGLDSTFARVSATQPNYTAQCLQFQDDDVDALFPGVGAEVALRIVADCATQGFDVDVFSQTSTVANTWFDDPNVDGAVLSGYQANPFIEEPPAVKEFRDAYEKFAPGELENKDFNYNTIGVWAGGKLFEAAAAAANVDASSTSEDVKKGLYALKDETLGGLTGPLNFTPGQPALVPCYFSQEVEDGSVASPTVEPICFSADEVKQIGAIAAQLAG